MKKGTITLGPSFFSLLALALLASTILAGADDGDKPKAPEGSIVAKCGQLHVVANRIVERAAREPQKFDNAAYALHFHAVSQKVARRRA